MKENSRSPISRDSAAVERGVSLLDYWSILVERRWVVAISVAWCLALGLLFNLLSIPKYRASTTLQIERQGPEILKFQDILSYDPYGYYDFYQTQYQIIESRTVLRLAAERLDLANDPRFANRKRSPLNRLLRWAGSLAGGGESASGADADAPISRAAGFIASGLSVDPVAESHLVTISFMDREPELARDVANAVADAYQRFSLESVYSTTDQASEFLAKEVARLQAEIGELERRLQEYGSSKSILALSDGVQDISEQALADLNARLTESRGRMAVVKARYTEVREALPDAFPEVQSSSLINNLKQQYAALERQHSQMAKRFKPGWPELEQLEEELSLARRRLDIETNAIASQVRLAAKSEYEQALAEVVNLEQQVEQQKSEVQRVNRDAIQYAGLKAEIDSRRKVLTSLVTRQSETETSGQLRETHTSNIRVVDPAAVPARPALPRKKLNLIVFLALGLSLGVGLAFVLHYVDNTIKTEGDIARYGSGLPLLGRVPLFEPLRVVYGQRARPGEEERNDEPNDPAAASPELASHLAPRSSFAEALKNLRTSLLLASPEQPPRCVLVTSCEPGAGKSTIAINLAIVLTQMGRRVLLIDADLRRPRIHDGLGLSNEIGLTNYLSGNAEPAQLFQELQIPLLSVITSGPTPPNPSELLGSTGLATLLARLGRSREYDHLILDSPPMLQVTDSLILATRADATILVVRAGMTSRESLSQGVARLRQGRAHVAGAVFNAVSERLKPYDYYYRHYGHDDATRDARRNERKGARPRLKVAVTLWSRRGGQKRRNAG